MNSVTKKKINNMSGLGRIPKKKKTTPALVVPVVEVEKKEEKKPQKATPPSKYKKWDLKKEDRANFSYLQLAIYLKNEKIESLEDVIGWVLANRRRGNWMMDVWSQLVIHMKNDRLAISDFDAKSPVFKKLYPIWLQQVVIEVCIAENLPDVRFFAILPTMRELWQTKAVRNEYELMDRFKAQVHSVWTTVHSELWDTILRVRSVAQFFTVIDNQELQLEFECMRWIQRRFDGFFQVYKNYLSLKQNNSDYGFQQIFAPRILPLFPLSLEPRHLQTVFDDLGNHAHKNKEIEASLDQLKYVLMQKQEEEKRVLGTNPQLLVQQVPPQATSVVTIAKMRDPRIRSDAIPQKSSTQELLQKLKSTLTGSNAKPSSTVESPSLPDVQGSTSASAALIKLREITKQLTNR